MNTNNSLRQFVVDGLIGVVTVLLIYGIYICVWLLLLGDGFDFLGFLITAPLSQPTLVPIILTAFISIGVGGRFLETIPSRRYWFVRILPSIGISCMVGFVSSMISVFIAAGNYIDITMEGILLLLSLIGAILGYLIGGLTGLIFFPQKRLNKIIVGAIAGAFANTPMLGTIILVIILIGQS